MDDLINNLLIMKTIKQILTLLFFAAPLLTFGQIYDKDSIFILERKALEFGKTLTGKSRNEMTGFTWRIDAGFCVQPTEANIYFQPAAVSSYSLEFGYRLQFLEAGFRHFRTGLGFGQDNPFPSGISGPDIIVSYNIPSLMGLVSNLGTARIHIPIKKVPVFLHFGAGQSVFRFSDNFISEVYYVDGTRKYISTRPTPGVSPVVRAFTSNVGIGFSKGPFFAGLEWWQLRGKKDAFGNRYSNRLRTMHIGLQMNTGQKKKTMRTKYADPIRRKRVAIGINSLATIAPFIKNSGTGSGYSADMSVNVGKKTAILGSFQFKLMPHGYTKTIDSNIKYGEWFSNAAGKTGRHLLYAGTLLNPRNNFRLYTYYGLGYYYSIDKEQSFIIDPFYPPVENNFERSGGVVMGTGFQFKYIHSQILLHKTFKSAPVILEWNLGGRMLF